MKTLFPTESEARPSNNPPPPPGLESESADHDAWKLIMLELQNVLDEESFLNWIRPLKCRDAAGSRLILSAPDPICYQGLRNEYLHTVEACKKRIGLSHLKLELELDDGPLDPSHFSEDFDSKGLLNVGKPDPDPRTNREGLEEDPETNPDSQQIFSSSLSTTSRLNSGYTFASFVKGPSNQFALASCLNVAANPGTSYNPLFLYGSTGLGKTHLLHAVGNQVRTQFPDLVVSYISSERFMNEMIYCIRHNKMWDFRQKYRHCDLFLMDDIQFISGNKAATQEEFFHTFNTLYEAKKQIIITSDLFPQDIPDIEERLRNRFQWGLIADIQPPDAEHRIAILMNKAEKLRVHLSHEVADYIATHAKRNIRELEGALHRIAAFAALQGRPLDKAIAMETFHSMIGEAPSQLEIETVQKAVADHFNLRVSDLKSKKRQRILTLPRQMAMYLARKHTQASYPDIGAKFGGKDHTTVMHACKKIGSEKNHDLDLKANLDALDRQLEQLH